VPLSRQPGRERPREPRPHAIGVAADAAAVPDDPPLLADGDDVDAVLEPILDGLRRAAPQGLAETKALLTAKVLETFDREAADLTALSARLFASPQAREGMTAFLERRDPTWVL